MTLLAFALLACQDIRSSAQAPGRTLVLYEVSDLLQALTVPERESESTARSEGPTREWEADLTVAFKKTVGVGFDVAHRLRPAAQHLQELLRGFVQPPLDAGKDSLQISNGTLAVHASPEQQAWIAAFLALQLAPPPSLRVGTRILEMPSGGFQRLGLKGSSGLLGPAELESFLKGAIEQGVDLLSSPKFKIFCRQRADLGVTDQVAYIKEWRLEIVEPGHQEIADPIVAVAREGFELELFAVPLDAHTFGLEVHLVRSQVQRPIPTKQVRLAANREDLVEIGLPEVTRVTLTARVRLQEGASAVFMTPSKEGRDLAVVVTLEQVLPAGEDGLGERPKK